MIFGKLLHLMKQKNLKYSHGSNLIKRTFGIYADFETTLEKTNDCGNYNPVKHFSIVAHNHKSCSFTVSIKYGHGDDKKITKTVVVMIVLMNFVKYLKKMLKVCYLRNKKFKSHVIYLKRVYDHCVLQGNMEVRHLVVEIFSSS